MSARHARTAPARRNALPAFAVTATAGTFVALSTITIAAAQRPEAPTITRRDELTELDDTEQADRSPSDGEPDPNPSPGAPRIPPGAQRASSAPSAPTEVKPSPKVSKTPHAAPKTKPKKRKKPGVLEGTKDALKEELKHVVPGIEKIPDWARPIVHDAQHHAAKGTTVQAYMNRSGKLVVWVRVDEAKTAQPGLLGGMLNASTMSVDTPTVDVRLVVDDPTKATRSDPTKVTVTVTNPDTAETTTKTAKVTAPAKVTDVATKTVTKAVQESSKAETSSLPA
ncbi:hypothetical protein [Streptomyces sp. NPDC058092]|uniref:hypothetical protein n=1 Tax=Streptomyces sp. NPDC058092 TaxID=3346336 RepID=UPI0036E9A43E